jgi:acyl dehydratase
MNDVPGEISGEWQEFVQRRVDEYAVASGDHNPIHIDPQYAASTPFKSTIVHGMLAFGVLAEMMAAYFGENWVSGSFLKMRFRAPIYVGTVAIPRAVLQSDKTDNGSRVVEYVVTFSDDQGNVFVDGTARIDFPENNL